MKKLTIVLVVLILFSILSANEYKFYTIDIYPKKEYIAEEVGGLYVNTTLADSTSEYWTYRVFQDNEDYLNKSCRSINGIEKLPAGIYEVRFPFNHLEYPLIPNVQIVTGYVTVVEVYIGSRLVLGTDQPAVTFHLINLDNGIDTGKNEKIIYASETLNFDIVPGKYQIYITNVFEEARTKPEEPLEEAITFDFEIGPWEILRVKI